MTHPSDMAVLVERIGKLTARDMGDEPSWIIELAVAAGRAATLLAALSTDQRTGQEVAGLVEQARRICAQHDPSKGYQYLVGQRDDYMPMTAVIAALTKDAPPVEADLREAFFATQAMLETIARTNSTNMREVRERIVANRSALQQFRSTPGAGLPAAAWDALVDAAKARADFVAAREAMNAAIPADQINATPAEYALYDERFKADHAAEREHFRTALRLAQVAEQFVAALIDNGPALAASPPPVDASGVVIDRALLEALMRNRVGEQPTRGWLRDNDEVRTAMTGIAAALHAAPAAEPDHIGGVWMPGPDEAPGAGEKRDD